MVYICLWQTGVYFEVERPCIGGGGGGGGGRR